MVDDLREAHPGQVGRHRDRPSRDFQRRRELRCKTDLYLCGRLLSHAAVAHLLHRDIPPQAPGIYTPPPRLAKVAPCAVEGHSAGASSAAARAKTLIKKKTLRRSFPTRNDSGGPTHQSTQQDGRGGLG